MCCRSSLFLVSMPITGVSDQRRLGDPMAYCNRYAVIFCCVEVFAQHTITPRPPLPQLLKLHILLPPIVRVPCIRSLYSCAWESRRLQKIKGHSNNRSLHRRVVGLPARISKRKVAENKSGYTTLLNDIFCRPNHYRRDAICFEMPGYQTHGLMTHRSQRHK